MMLLWCFFLGDFRYENCCCFCRCACRLDWTRDDMAHDLKNRHIETQSTKHSHPVGNAWLKSFRMTNLRWQKSTWVWIRSRWLVTNFKITACLVRECPSRWHHSGSGIIVIWRNLPRIRGYLHVGEICLTEEIHRPPHGISSQICTPCT